MEEACSTEILAPILPDYRYASLNDGDTLWEMSR